MKKQTVRRREGIEVRHSRSCASRGNGACNCTPTYQANVWDKRSKKRIRKTFRDVSAAQAWRTDALAALRKGTMRAPAQVTLQQEADEWLRLAKQGLVRTKSGDPYKPSTISSYEESLHLHVLPHLGPVRLANVTRSDVQKIADELLASGRSASTVRNAINPLRTIFRFAVRREHAWDNPTRDVELPAERANEVRVASPSEAVQLIDVIPTERDRTAWSLAFFAGLRCGELLGLKRNDIDLDAGLIHVRRAWDRKNKLFVVPKSKAGTRRVPVPTQLHAELAAYLSKDGDPSELLFPGRRPDRPMSDSALRRHAEAAWSEHGLERIGLHEARHTYASLMIAAGLTNLKALSTYMGHASVTITIDRYSHLLPGSEAEAAAILSNFLNQCIIGERECDACGIAYSTASEGRVEVHVASGSRPPVLRQFHQWSCFVDYDWSGGGSAPTASGSR